MNLSSNTEAGTRFTPYNIHYSTVLVTTKTMRIQTREDALKCVKNYR